MIKSRLLHTVIFLILTLAAVAQVRNIHGIVADKSGVTLPGVTVSYPDHKILTVTNADGEFSIARHNGWKLRFTCVGFDPLDIVVGPDVKSPLNLVLNEEESQLHEVVIKARKGKYTRKGNPAVELMRRVIEAKKRTDLKNNDYYTFRQYEKVSLAMNNVDKENFSRGLFKKFPWLVNHVQRNPFNDKFILPFSYNETSRRYIYRRTPQDEKTIVLGQKSAGINKILQVGDMLDVVLRDIFTDVDIYEDQVRLLQKQFPSPIGRTAISFYRFYIEDTVKIDNDSCYHLEFTPNNAQDFGFRGSLYIVKDSSLHVKRCDLTLPRNTGVNFVDNMQVRVQYTKLPDGQWVLTHDDMGVELTFYSENLASAFVTRRLRNEDYSFEPLPAKDFRGKAKLMLDPNVNLRDEDFWKVHRAIDLNKSEAIMDNMADSLRTWKYFKWFLPALQLFAENFVETGSKTTKSKFDIGPVNTFLSYNFVDGLRMRFGGKTTAALNNHLFAGGYMAFGAKSQRTYYGATLTYAFNKKQNQPFEFPQRNIEFETTSDVMSPADRMLTHNKDNIFMGFRTQKVEEMYFYDRQKLSYIYETDWGLSFKTALKLENNRPTGSLYFAPMLGSERYAREPLINKIRTTELSFGVRFCPGQTFINSKQRRIPVNLDPPEFNLTHSVGIKGFIGGQYRMNFTEMQFYKRQWLGSWGSLDIHLNAGAQWNKLPFPLLIMPPVSLSYVSERQDIESNFNLMRNMEFINDRYVFGSLSWDLAGKLFNRIPGLRKLRLREFIAIKSMVGYLSKKNNPWHISNMHDNTLMQMPRETWQMDPHRPYTEMVLGVHNIMSLFAIDYVHRFSYHDNPAISRHGIRMAITVDF